MGTVKKNNIKNNINFLFLQQHNWSQKIWCNVVKKMTINHTGILTFTTLDILQSKNLTIVKGFTVLILCTFVLIMETDILKKKV